MLVVAVIGTLAMVGPRLLIGLQEFYLLTNARQEIQRDARTALENINRFLRQAKWRTIVVDTPTGQSPFSRVRFSHIDGRSFTYRQEGNFLIQEVDGVESVIARNLVYVAFTFPRSDFPRLVSVSMTMGTTIAQGRKKELELTIQKIRVMN